MDSQLHPEYYTRPQVSDFKMPNQQSDHSPNHDQSHKASSLRNRLVVVAVVVVAGWLVALLWRRAERQMRSDLEDAVRTELKDTEDRLELAQIAQLAALKEIAQTEFAKNQELQGKLEQEMGVLKKIVQQEHAKKLGKKNHDKIVANFEKELARLRYSIKRLQGKQAQLSTSNPPFKKSPPKIPDYNVVIDLPYSEKEYLPLPPSLFRKNQQGKTLPEVLYRSEEQLKKRVEYQKARIPFLDSRPGVQQAYLAKYNVPLDQAAEKEGREANEREWVRMNRNYGLEKLTTELPMCILSPSYNNNNNFRIEYSLNSIFYQNYTNFKVVVLDDLSSDGSRETYRKYFSFHRINKRHYSYIENSRRMTAMYNIYMGTIKHCPEDSIVINVDGDDELNGRNTLQLFNWAYQTMKAGVIYSNFLAYDQGIYIHPGFTAAYSEEERKEKKYRAVTMHFSHLRTSRRELLLSIDPKDLQDDQGNFLTIAADFATFVPFMELACGRVYKIEGEYNLLYNQNTGLNDSKDRERQLEVERKIRAKKPYDCDQEFNKRMGK